MAIEQDKLGLEIYKILTAPSYGFTLSMYDADGNGTITALNARWIYVKPQNMMLVLPEQDKPAKPEIFLWKQADDMPDDTILELISRLRSLSKQFGVGLTVNDFTHDNAPKAFAKAAEQERAESELSESYLAEGMTGTSKRSYLQLENARLVVLHSKKINEEVHGARSRNVKDVFIECNGERYRYPTKYLPGARAMTRHMSMGGSWSDPVGKAICESGREVVAYRRLIAEAEACGSTRLINKAKKYLNEVQSNSAKMQGPRGYIRISESILNRHPVSKKFIQARSTALGALSGISESVDLTEAYRFMAKRDITEDMNNLDAYTKVIQEAIIDISPQAAKNSSKRLIKGNLGAKCKMKNIVSNPSNPHEKIALFASALSETVDNDVIAITLSEISEKAEPTADDAKFVSGVYKTIRMNEYNAPKNDGAQELLECLKWADGLTKNILL